MTRLSCWTLVSSRLLLLLVTAASVTNAAAAGNDSDKSCCRVSRFLETVPSSEWAPWARTILREQHSSRSSSSSSSAAANDERFDLPCNVCLGVADALIGDLAEGIPLQDIIEAIVPICTTFVYDEDVCRGLLEANGPTLTWVIQNSATFDLNRFCAEGIGSTGCDEYVGDPELWLVPLPDTAKPPVSRPQVPEGTQPLKIVHIADMHLDPLYEPGSEAQCDKIICCQSIDGPASIEAAGTFGSYQPCDAPQAIVDETLRHILEMHPDVDMVFFTGDMPAHDIWRQSKEGNLAVIDQAFQSFQQFFGDRDLFTVFGNHEPHPLNVFSFEGLNAPAELMTEWISEDAWAHWQQWLPADQQANVLKTGQFSVSPREGLRLLGINNLYGYVNNWFIWMDVPDPNGQLEWLARELQSAEDAGEAVYILGHIPPGNHNMVPVWSHNFARIVNRYESTIRGQFYGHTHNDEFSVFYNDEEEGRASNVALVGPSVTTYEGLNPGYRVLLVDGARGAESTWTIMDIENWHLDLQEANAQAAQGNRPTWFKLYSMREAYGMADLSPESYDALARSLETDDDAFNFYYKAYWADSPERPPCTSSCRNELVCNAFTSDTSDKSRCPQQS